MDDHGASGVPLWSVSDQCFRPKTRQGPLVIDYLSGIDPGLNPCSGSWSPVSYEGAEVVHLWWYEESQTWPELLRGKEERKEIMWNKSKSTNVHISLSLSIYLTATVQDSPFLQCVQSLEYTEARPIKAVLLWTFTCTQVSLILVAFKVNMPFIRLYLFNKSLSLTQQNSLVSKQNVIERGFSSNWIRA